MRVTSSLVIATTLAGWACGGDPASHVDAASVQDASVLGQDAPASDAPASDAPSQDALADDAEAIDAGPSFADAEAPCTRDDAGRCAMLSWTATAAFPTSLDHHSTFVASSTSGDYLHVVGGVRTVREMLEEVYSSVYRARIDTTGAGAETAA